MAFCSQRMRVVVHVVLLILKHSKDSPKERNDRHKMIKVSLHLHLFGVFFWHRKLLNSSFSYFCLVFLKQKYFYIQCSIYAVWNECKSETCTLHRCSSFAKLIGHVWNMLDSCWEALVGFWPEGTEKYQIYCIDAWMLIYTHTRSVFRIVGS